MNKKKEQINQMLNLIMESSHSMPDYVFHYFVDFKKKREEKIFYNLIADSFLTLFSYCKLIFERARSQAFAILRTGIEQIAAVFVLTTKQGAIQNYVELYKLKVQFINIESEVERREFMKIHNIRKSYHEFFDYNWISSYVSDDKPGRNQLIKLAKLDEFLVDIENSLNAFSHGSVSVFDMSEDKWKVMEKYGKRANLICCKLYDFLCCSFHKIIGDEEFSKLPLDKFFKSFKLIYQDVFESEG